MENYITYTELTAGSDSVVYKGRKKGQLSFVALISTDKFMKPFITNHVGHVLKVIYVQWTFLMWEKTFAMLTDMLLSLTGEFM